MQLNYHQKREILEKGYVRVPGVVPHIMVDAALRTINHSIGEGMNVSDMTRFRARSYCPELQSQPVITDLVNKTPAFELAESVIGQGMIKPVGGGQIALRFPRMQDPPSRPGCHLDGMYSPHNGVPKGEIHNFTMLLGVMLSDLPNPNAGNLTLWPGTHRIYEEYFRKEGPLALLKGMPPVELSEPEQMLGRAGDVVLCHYQIAHGVASNVSSHPRYAIYFRLRHVEHDSQKFKCMTNIWIEWPGIREIIES